MNRSSNKNFISKLSFSLFYLHEILHIQTQLEKPSVQYKYVEVARVSWDLDGCFWLELWNSHNDSSFFRYGSAFGVLTNLTWDWNWTKNCHFGNVKFEFCHEIIKSRRTHEYNRMLAYEHHRSTAKWFLRIWFWFFSFFHRKSLKSPDFESNPSFSRLHWSTWDGHNFATRGRMIANPVI